MTCREQGQVGNFLPIKPSEKQEFLNSLLDMDRLETVIERSGDEIKNLASLYERKQEEEKQLVDRAGDLVAEISSLNISETFEDEEKIAFLKINPPKKNVANVSHIDAKIFELKSNSPKMEIPDCSELEVKKEQFQEIIRTVDNKLKSYDKNKILSSILEAKSQFKKIPEYQEELKSIRSKIASLEENKCYTCEQTWVAEKHKLEDLFQKEKQLLLKVSPKTLESYQDIIKQNEMTLQEIAKIEESRKIQVKELSSVEEEIRSIKYAAKIKFESLTKEHAYKISLEREKQQTVALVESDYRNKVQELSLLETGRKAGCLKKKIDKKDATA